MRTTYQEILDHLKDRQSVFLITEMDQGVIRHFIYEENKEGIVDSIVQEARQKGRPVLFRQEEAMILVEPFFQEERMILLGGGHVSLALAEFAAKTGFSVTVADDRPTFANSVRFPWAREVLCESFGTAIEHLKIRPSDYVVILTRGHRWDGECLKKLYQCPDTAYLGMIGSKRRVKSLKEQLVEEGIESKWLERLHSPVGLDIGAVTPEEIAVSILAEVIEAKRKPCHGVYQCSQSDVDMRVVQELACIPESRKDMGKAVVTILETKGSVPRKAGAKMIVYRDGFLSGTIGGGCAEASLLGRARALIGTGSFEICEVDMTGTIAEEEGMVCGGTMKVLIEDCSII